MACVADVLNFAGVSDFAITVRIDPDVFDVAIRTLGVDAYGL